MQCTSPTNMETQNYPLFPGFSTVSDSQGPTEFTSTHMNFSEDSNSQSSGTTTPAKRLKTD